MPEGDSVENRKGNHCNTDKPGAICQTKRASSEYLLTPFLWCIHLNSWIKTGRETEIKNNTKKQDDTIMPL